MIYRTSKEKIDEYYASQYLNQSAIKLLLSEGIESFNEKFNQVISTSDLYYEEKEHFIIGSAVDCRLTQGREEFKKQFHISTLIKKPGEKAMSIIKEVFDKVLVDEKQQHEEDFSIADVSTLDIYQSYILHTCVEREYYPKWGLDAKFSGILKEDGGYTISKEKDKEPVFKGGGYWEDLKLANGKQILSDLEGTISSTIIEAFLNHDNTAKLFQDRKEVDILYQVPIYFMYKGVQCKALIDKIIVNHLIKTIYLIDIKTTSRQISRFVSEVKFRRYDIQGSFYQYGVEYVQASKFPLLDKIIGKNLRGYRVANFAFIAQSTVKPGYPVIFPMTSRLVDYARIGNPSVVLTDYTRYGWDYGIDLYKKWLDYGLSVERKIDELKGVLHINSDFEYIDMVVK